MIVEAHHICHLYISQCDVDCWNSQSQNRNVMLTKLTTCPDINRLPIWLLLQHLRGKVSGGASKTWVTFIQYLFWQNTGILKTIGEESKWVFSQWICISLSLQACLLQFESFFVWFIPVVVNIALTHQTKPVGPPALQSPDQSLRVSPRPLCSCLPAEGFPAGKGKILVFLSTLQMDKILQKSIKEQHQ